MTLDQTLPISEAAMFQPISNSLSTKNNTETYLLIGAGVCVLVFVVYQYGKHQGMLKSQRINPTIEPKINKKQVS